MAKSHVEVLETWTFYDCIQAKTAIEVQGEVEYLKDKHQEGKLPKMRRPSGRR